MNPIRIFLGSFYCPATYRDARSPQPGMHLFYSFLLVLVTSAIVIIAGINYLHSTLLENHNGNPALLDQFIIEQAAQIPVMTLQDGTLRVNAKQPYTLSIAEDASVKHPTKSRANKDDFAWAVIDTTGTTTLHSMDAPVLITAHEIIVKSKNETRVYTFDKLTPKSSAPLIINRAMVDDGTRRILSWLHKNSWKIDLLLGIPAWIMFALVTYVLRLIMLMALGLVGIIVSRILDISMDFATAVRVAAVAYTPVAVFSAVAFSLTALSFPSWVLFVLGGWMITATLLASRSAE